MKLGGTCAAGGPWLSLQETAGTLGQAEHGVTHPCVSPSFMEGRLSPTLASPDSVGVKGLSPGVITAVSRVRWVNSPAPLVDTPACGIQ